MAAASDPGQAQGLGRFLEAQGEGEAGLQARALRELGSGAKRGHWIWFVLPQLRGLGHSAEADLYGIADLEEARAYLADPLLRRRLEDVIAVIAAQLRLPGQTLPRLLGGELDAAKTISSLTLFEAAGLHPAGALLDQLQVSRCPLTLRRLRS
jgi:uncharacterized protein (DUF1810 family)